MSTHRPYPHEPAPVGRTPEDQERNHALLAGYEYERYVEALTGYTGQDLQRIASEHWHPAVRTRVGPRGTYKAGLARLPDGTLVTAACRNRDDARDAEGRFEIRI